MRSRVESGSIEFGIVAALEREVTGLVRGWRRGSVEGVPSYECEKAALVCAGTGISRAQAATKALVEKFSPKVLISIGFAGSCSAELIPGSILVPASVVESATGKSHATAFGQGCLVTVDKVAGPGLKKCSAARFGAQAVDMEAAGVAAVAADLGKEFLSIKAISDGATDDLSFLDGFVEPDGFATGRFVAHIMMRPMLWSRVAGLQRGSKLAAAELHKAVAGCIADWQGFREKHSAVLVKA
jgi:adenosylhomocysteine nucleosidase